MSEFNWTCPYCNSVQTVTDAKSHSGTHRIDVGDNDEGMLAVRISAIGCSNPECKRTTIHLLVAEQTFDSLGNFRGVTGELATFRWPRSVAKVQPSYIPRSIVQDYQEACEIALLSPKASATLARRCLQGMIRDFCVISKARLIDEIRTLRKLAEQDALPRGVTHESIDAIDAVRQVGNIGAHMESDINVIVEVDSEEASTLLRLIETLFDDWYVARRKREERFAAVTAIAKAKSDEKKLPTAEPAALPKPE